MSEKVLIDRKELDDIAFKLEALGESLYNIAKKLDEAWTPIKKQGGGKKE